MWWVIFHVILITSGVFGALWVLGQIAKALLVHEDEWPW